MQCDEANLHTSAANETPLRRKSFGDANISYESKKKQSEIKFKSKLLLFPDADMSRNLPADNEFGLDLDARNLPPEVSWQRHESIKGELRVRSRFIRKIGPEGFEPPTKGL
jgi:hypothetical protein